MLKQLRLLFLITLASVTVAKAQVGQGGLKGKVLDKSKNEPIPFANVIVELNGNQVGGATTDFDGNYFIKPLAPGKYDVKASYVGYQQIQISGVIVRSDKIEFLNIQMTQGIELKAFEKVEYEVPLISKDNTTSGGTVTREDIARMPGRSAEMAALTVGGIYSADGERGNVRGAREEATDTYIDGVKVRGSANIPNQAIEQVEVKLGGLEAQYGDATGGVINVTLRKSSLNYFGGLEVVSSQLTDPYNYNLLGYTLSGPLITRKDPNDETRKKSLVGFFLSGELKSELDPRPSAIGSWKVRDDVMQRLRNEPLSIAPGGQGTVQNAEYIRKSDLEQITVRQDVANRGMLLMTKLDFNTSANTSLTIGGNIDINRDRGDRWFAGSSGPNAGAGRNNDNIVYNNMLFNSGNNPLFDERTWRVYGNFTHRFTGDGSREESASVIKNAFYTIQADFSKNDRKIQDPNHRNNFFDYGHIGYFVSEFEPSYKFDTIPGTAGQEFGMIQDGFRQTAYNFTPGTANPVLSRYNEFYYGLYENPQGYYENWEQVMLGGGLPNGRMPRSAGRGQIYDLWNTAGMPYNSYQLADNSQFRIRATGSADIKNHAILVGFEFEQRSDRAFSLSPYGLWDRARQLANSHVLELDIKNPQVTYNGTLPVITYDRLNASPGEYDASSQKETQTFFDYNLRKELGLNPDGNDYIDVFAQSPDRLKLNYFSASDLLMDGGNSLVSYFGYDHTGRRISKAPSFNDFFTKRDEYGNLTRPVGAFEPIYIAGYIQDKFSFDDLVFNVGLRIDRFDANQMVLKDPYSMFETRKASELPENLKAPGNIGPDYVVYTTDIKTVNVTERSEIAGFRSGNVWYNAEGAEIADPSILVTSSGNVAPWLVDPSKTRTKEDLSENAFRDYDPQIIVMPRIAFSFPISDEALFFAHYDVLASRPGVGLRFNPMDYLFLETNNNNSVLNNPNLKPERTITYELGFQQRLTQSSSLKLSAFYNELRNQVQVINVNFAFPRSYNTYGNIDFGTVKGMTVAYDLRRTANVSLRATYTLQFADGTGSNAQTGFNMVQAGQPNLRTVFPLDFDQRHNFTASMDFRYGSGKDYNGPVLFDQQILSRTGLNILGMGGSGVPFSQQQNITPDASISGGRSVMKGSFNGSRLPWQFRLNFRLDKDIDLQWGKDEKKKKAALNVYVWVQNAFNNQNILKVYRATGNPDDDGYLDAPQFLPAIASLTDPDAFREQYALKVNNPRNYSMPRTIRLGAILSF
jgi:hypothetical protein